MADIDTIVDWDVYAEYAQVRQWETDHRHTFFRPPSPRVYRVTNTVISGMEGGLGSGLAVTTKAL